MRKIVLTTLACTLGSAALISGCTTNGQSTTMTRSTIGTTPPPVASNAAAQRGQAFAQSHCSSCHAIGNANDISPNPASPPFARVINTAGLTPGTLNSWLKNSHNFPEMMNFSIDDAHIDDLATYMLTLRDPNYRPPVH